jgi:hypothetical protein
LEIDYEEPAMNFPHSMLSPPLAKRIEELRSMSNIAELRVVALDENGVCALALVVPRICGEVSAGGWRQPDEPFLMRIDCAAFLSDRALH